MKRIKITDIHSAAKSIRDGDHRDGRDLPRSSPELAGDLHSSLEKTLRILK